MLFLQQTHLLQLEALELALHPLVLLQQSPVLCLELLRLCAVEGELVPRALRSLQVAQLLSRFALHSNNQSVVLLDQIADLCLQHIYLLLIDDVGVLKSMDPGVELGVDLPERLSEREGT